MNSGVQKYVKGTATVSNYFPVDHKGVAYICCQFCNFYRKTANRCGLTDEIIYNGDKYTGNHCPLIEDMEPTEKEEEEHDI